MSVAQEKQDKPIDGGPYTNAWQLLEVEHRQLEVCLSQLKSIPEESEQGSFRQMVDLVLQKLSTIADIEQRIVEKIAGEACLDKNGQLRTKISDIGENAKSKPSGNAVSVSPEAA